MLLSKLGLAPFGYSGRVAPTRFYCTMEVQIMSQASRTARRMSEDLKETASEAKHAAQTVGSDLLHKAQKYGAEATEAVAERLDGLKETAADYYRTGREKAREYEQALESRVQDRPIMSVLTAVAVGFVVGYLCKRS